MQSNYSFLYDKICQLEAGSINTILWRASSVRFVFDSAKSAHRHFKSIDDKSSGYWSPVFEFIPLGKISSSDSTLMEMTLPQDNLRPSSSPFSLGTRMVSYDGHFLKLFISASGTSWTHSIRRRKRFNPHENPAWDDQHYLSRTTHSLLPSRNISHILNF